MGKRKAGYLRHKPTSSRKKDETEDRCDDDDDDGRASGGQQCSLGAIRYETVTSKVTVSSRSCWNCLFPAAGGLLSGLPPWAERAAV